MKKQEAINLIFSACNKAEKEGFGWPKDMETAALIFMEEAAGNVLKAILDGEGLKEGLVRAGAAAAGFLVNYF